MGLHLHRAERTDLLADGLGALLSDPLPDPFAEELIIVPAKGVERWLSQRLSHMLGRGNAHDGICAGISFRNPRSLIAEITGTVDDDPWSPDAMVWPLLEVIDCSLDEPWCRTLAVHLGHFEAGEEKELRQGRRYAVARRLAGLFASYARQRPQLLVDWERDIAGDIDSDLDWQPQLWRALLERVDADPPHVRHAKTLARLQQSPTDLPVRLSLFGHTRLPATEVELLNALATHHDLHLWLPHPSDDLWRKLAGEHGAIPRRDDTSHRNVGHPLLATLGRDLRELQRSLPAHPHTDEYLGGRAHPDTLLGWLQSDITANEVRPDGRTLRNDDRSVQVHSCHGPARQIDVLREVLLGLLADDPHAGTARHPGDVPGHRDLRTADQRRLRARRRRARRTPGAPAAGAPRRPLAHPDQPAARRRQPIARLGGRPRHRQRGAQPRAGRPGAVAVRLHRRRPREHHPLGAPGEHPLGLRPGAPQAVRRRLRPQHLAFRHRPGAGWRGAVGRLARVDRLDAAARRRRAATASSWQASSPNTSTGCSGPSMRSTAHGRCADWLTALADGIDLLTRVDDNDAWQTSQVQREFAEVLATAGPRGDTVMRLPDIRALLGRHLAGRPTRANFRTGTLTVCTMVPMRSVPHRVVCLVGLDDGVFPRLGIVDGDDVLARNPMTGERDIRSEDRQLLLDAIGAATEKLVITYTGANEYSGQDRPPAVPLAELLDTLDMTTD